MPSRIITLWTAATRRGLSCFTLTAEADGDIYAHFPGVLFQGMSTECGLYVNGTKVSDYYIQ